MDQDSLKRAAARAAMDEVPADAVIGIGSGSTVAHFIELLGESAGRVAGAVSSSERSSQLLRNAGLKLQQVFTTIRRKIGHAGAPLLRGVGVYRLDLGQSHALKTPVIALAPQGTGAHA